MSRAIYAIVVLLPQDSLTSTCFSLKGLMAKTMFFPAHCAPPLIFELAKSQNSDEPAQWCLLHPSAPGHRSSQAVQMMKQRTQGTM